MHNPSQTEAKYEETESVLDEVRNYNAMNILLLGHYTWQKILEIYFFI